MEILDGEKIFTWRKIALQLRISFLFWISDNFSGIHGDGYRTRLLLSCKYSMYLPPSME